MVENKKGKQKDSSIDLVEALLQLDQRNAELKLINSVQLGLAAEMNMKEIYNLVGDKIKDIFDSQATIISSFNFENNTEEFSYIFEDGERFEMEARPIDKVRRLLIDSRDLLYINENADEVWSKITGEEPTAIPGTKFPKSALYVPMKVGDQVQGYVSLQNLDRENAFSDSDIQLLSTLANSMSTALENARLFSETEQRNAELAVINSVQEGLVREMDMKEIYSLVGDKIKDIFDSQVTIIATFNHENNAEHFQYMFENDERVYPEPRPFDKLRQRIINTKKTINIQENFSEALITVMGEVPNAIPGTSLPKSILFVPLLIGDSVKGYVSLQNIDREHAFSDSDIQLLITLANSMSVALENARLFSETEQRNAELAVINSVQEGLVREMDMQEIYNLVGDRIKDIFDSQVTMISTFNHENNTEQFQYLVEDNGRLYPEPRPYDKLRQQIIDSKKTINIQENLAEVVATIMGEVPSAIPGTSLPKSILFVPLLIGDSVKGYVSLQNLDREHAFSDSDIQLLITLANGMSVALENARLFSETEQRNAELAVINSVQEGLVSEMDMEAIYSLVGKRICKVLKTQTLLIRTFDHDTTTENWEFAIEKGERLYSNPRPFIWANKYIIKTKEPLLINENYLETARKYGDKESGVSKGLPPKSAIFVPMIVGNTVMGSVSLQNVEKEKAFTESDVRLLGTLTNSMSVALENARLFNETARLLSETEQRASELQTVNNISRAMVSQLEFDALIELVGEQMKDTFKADIVFLAIHDLETNMLHFPYIYGETAESRPFGNGITEKIILNHEPMLINQKMDEAYDKMKADRKGIMVQSFLGVPIIASSKAIGVISVQSIEAENCFDEYDQRLLTTIAANLGVAMQNAEAYKKMREALAELKSTQEQLIHSEKMASLGELTAGIAHEIQNPLNFVNNFSDVSADLVKEMNEEMRSGNTEDVKSISNDLKQNLEKISHHGKRASSIVKGMLEHSRTSAGHKELTDINILADEYLRLAYHGLRAKDKSFNADFITDFDTSLPKIKVVSQDIGRVLLNLINNAFHAVSMKLKQGEKDFKAVVSVSTLLEDNAIVIKVKDNGEGIPANVVDKIFQPFFTTKPSGEGTGLGLSLGYDIIKSHGGKLKVESKQGEGSKFKIHLPL